MQLITKSILKTIQTISCVLKGLCSRAIKHDTKSFCIRGIFLHVNVGNKLFNETQLVRL